MKFTTYTYNMFFICTDANLNISTNVTASNNANKNASSKLALS